MFDHRAQKYRSEYVAHRVPSRDTVRRMCLCVFVDQVRIWRGRRVLRPPQMLGDVPPTLWCGVASRLCSKSFFLLERIVMSVQCGLCCRDTLLRTHS